MNADLLYSIWAPPEGNWTPWAKAVLFAHYEYISPRVANPNAMGVAVNGIPSPEAGQLPLDPATSAAQLLQRLQLPPPGSTALVFDLPGPAGVWAGVAAARLGYRPVPLYNACPVAPLKLDARDAPAFAPASMVGPTPATRLEVVNVTWILIALADAAAEVQSIPMPPTAPPAFLLDANRSGGSVPPGPGEFDNRSISFPTDFPSAALLASRGIRSVLLIRERDLLPAMDLSHTLGRWSKAGIEILSRPLTTDGPSQRIDVPRPNWWGALWYYLSTAASRRRGRLGGYGGMVPFPGAHGSGG